MKTKSLLFLTLVTHLGRAGAEKETKYPNEPACRDLSERCAELVPTGICQTANSHLCGLTCGHCGGFLPGPLPIPAPYPNSERPYPNGPLPNPNVPITSAEVGSDAESSRKDLHKPTESKDSKAKRQKRQIVQEPHAPEHPLKPSEHQVKDPLDVTDLHVPAMKQGPRDPSKRDPLQPSKRVDGLTNSQQPVEAKDEGPWGPVNPLPRPYDPESNEVPPFPDRFQSHPKRAVFGNPPTTDSRRPPYDGGHGGAGRLAMRPIDSDHSKPVNGGEEKFPSGGKNMRYPGEEPIDYPSLDPTIPVDDTHPHPRPVPYPVASPDASDWPAEDPVHGEHEPWNEDERRKGGN